MSFSVERFDAQILDQIKISDFEDTKKEELLKADLIVLPVGWQAHQRPEDFSVDVVDFQKYIRLNYPDINIGIFGEAGKTTYQDLRSDHIYLETLYWVVSQIGIDTIAIILSDYLTNKYRGNPGRQDNNVSLDYLLENLQTGWRMRIKYQGPVNGLPDLKEIMKEGNVSDEMK